MGGQTKYTDAIAEEIVERMSEGTPLAVICRSIGISDDAARDWQKVRPEFERAIARAREVGFDAIAQRARLTMRGLREDQGGESTGDFQRDKAIAEFDLKLLAKWDPKRYGDKIALTGGGPDDAPIQTVARIAREIIDPKGE